MRSAWKVSLWGHSVHANWVCHVDASEKARGPVSRAGGRVLISFFGPKLEVQIESERRRVGVAATEQE